MPADPDKCRPVSQGRVDFRIWNDQAELADLYPELRSPPSQFRIAYGPTHAHVR